MTIEIGGKRVGVKEVVEKGATLDPVVTSTSTATSSSVRPDFGGNEETIEDDRGETSTPSWSSIDPYNYADARAIFEAMGLPSGFTDNVAGQLSAEFFNEFGRWPTASELAEWQRTGSVVNYYASGYYNLPTFFGYDDGESRTWFHNVNSELRPMSGEELTRMLGPADRAEGKGFRMLSAEDVQALLGVTSGSRGRGGGGRGGGGRGPVFDRDQLMAAATDIWRGYLLEEPADVAGLVESYIRRATSFAREGGSLDFSTFIRNAALDTPRGKMIYAQKPDSIPHEQYLATYVAPVRALGLRESRTADLAIAGARRAAAPGAFSAQLQRIGEFRNQNQGSFGQRFANLLRQTGVIGT